MSIESAKAFVAKMKMDGEFAKKVAECKDVDERMAFAYLKHGVQVRCFCNIKNVILL